MNETVWLETVRERIATLGQPEDDYKDDHHTLHSRRDWLVRPEGKYLRNNMIAHGLHRATHNLIHELCPQVPTPQYHTLAHVANDFERGLPILDGIDQYCDLVDESSRHYKCNPIERALNDLSIEALRMQIPLLRGDRHE